MSATTHININMYSDSDIELNGIIYFIPDKFINNKSLGFEYRKLYKFMLASIINYNITHNKLRNIAQITLTNITNYIEICDKMFSYVITGKINIIKLTNMERELINNIPSNLIPNLTQNIIEEIITI